MILPDFARITEENHVPAFASYAVDHAPLCQPDRSSPAPSPPPPIARHHRHRYLRRDLRLQVLGEIAIYGRKKADWLQTFLELPGGLPSKDTFRRVFARIKPAAFQSCFRGWMQALATTLGVKQIAIDGKTVRRSHDRGAGKSALHLVSAWATANHLTLGQVAVSDKSNEITAIPRTVGVARPLRGRRDH